MLMKKKVLGLLGLALCLNLTAMAKIPSDDISLGGICPDYTIDYVQSIYGEGDYTPVSYDYRTELYTSAVSYGGTAEFWADAGSADAQQKVTLIKITANNGFATPKGIHVGSTKKDVLSAYGMPDSGMSRGNKKSINTRGPGKYPEILQYRALEKPAKNICFYIQNGVVVEIRAGYDY